MGTFFIAFVRICLVRLREQLVQVPTPNSHSLVYVHTELLYYRTKKTDKMSHKRHDCNSKAVVAAKERAATATAAPASSSSNSKLFPKSIMKHWEHKHTAKLRVRSPIFEASCSSHWGMHERGRRKKNSHRCTQGIYLKGM